MIRGAPPSSKRYSLKKGVIGILFVALRKFAKRKKKKTDTSQQYMSSG